MNIRKQILFYLLNLSILISAENTSSVHNNQISVIFDMNGVLVQTGGTTRILGLSKFIAYAFTKNPFSLKKQIKGKLFDLLNELEERQPNEVDACDDHGDTLPQSMCNWMKGVNTPEQLRNAVDAKLACKNQNLESSILHDISDMMFTPEKFSQTQNLVPDSINFVKQLKQQGYKIYILSNFCSKSFEIIKNENPEFFELFDGVVISGDVGMIKPDPNIYKHLLNTHNIDCKKACFIDDVAINVQAAQNVGIYSLICPAKQGYFTSEPDIDTVKQNFYTWRNSL